MSDFALLGMHVLMKFCEPCWQAMSRIQVDGTCMEKPPTTADLTEERRVLGNYLL